MSDLFESIKNAGENEMARNLSSMNKIYAFNKTHYIIITCYLSVINNIVGKFKNLLYSKDENVKLNNQNRWCKVAENIRNDFKNLFLEMILTENASPSQSAQCIALIACAEIPKGLWPDCLSKI